jgi:hypothetical protein
MVGSRRERGKGRRGKARPRRRPEEKIRVEKEEGAKRLPRKKIIYVILIIASILTGFFVLNSLLHSPGFPYKAAIIDHLSISAPNQTFVDMSTAILNASGFSVDYYKGENVTVDFFRSLPSRGYGLIVLRVHSAIFDLETGTKQTLVLFTSERFSETAHKDLYDDQQLAQVGFYGGDPDTYFGIAPKFVRNSMKGRFQNTIIIMMGCDGMGDPEMEMAEAFINKGAKVYIGWSESVEVNHTDVATIHLLKFLVAENRTIREAVEKTNNDVGPDHLHHDSVLDYYPKDRGDLNIPKIAGVLAITVSHVNSRRFRLGV